MWSGCTWKCGNDDAKWTCDASGKPPKKKCSELKKPNKGTKCSDVSVPNPAWQDTPCKEKWGTAEDGSGMYQCGYHQYGHYCMGDPKESKGSMPKDKANDFYCTIFQECEP